MGSHTPALEALFSVSRGWIWLCHAYICNEFIMAKDSPHITVQCITHINVALVSLLVSVCCDTAHTKAGYTLQENNENGTRTVVNGRSIFLVFAMHSAVLLKDEKRKKKALLVNNGFGLCTGASVQADLKCGPAGHSFCAGWQHAPQRF